MSTINISQLLNGILDGTVRLEDVTAILSGSPPPPPAPISWDEAENRQFEYGVSKGILFLMNDDGTYAGGRPWNGLTNITDEPEGADLAKFYADGIFYAGVRGSEQYRASIEAYTYPDEFAQCDGSEQPIPGMYVSQQKRRRFGLCWRTEIGNANTETLGYKIHIAYGLSASPSEKPHDTVNDSLEINPFTWNIEGNAVAVNGYKPTVKLEFDSTKLSPARMRALEDLLYGSAEPILVNPDDLLNILEIAYGPDVIGRQQITGEIDYVKDGVLYRGANAPTILVSDESELDDLAPICNPGSFAFNQDMSRMWQLDANETWVRMI